MVTAKQRVDTEDVDDEDETDEDTDAARPMAQTQASSANSCRVPRKPATLSPVTGDTRTRSVSTVTRRTRRRVR